MLPENILGIVISMIVGAVVCILAGVFIIAKRKKMPYEVWIPLLFLFVLGTIGLIAVALCLAAAFTIAT